MSSEKTLTKDVFLRSHVVEPEPQQPLVSTYNEPKWPQYVLAFDTETTLDPKNSRFFLDFTECVNCKVVAISLRRGNHTRR